jgi:hypothetical protein
MSDLERELERVGRELDYPEGRGIAEAVTARLLGEPAPRRSLRRAALIAAVIVLAVAGAAVAARFALRGVFIAPSPTPAPAPIGEGLRLGRAVSLPEARAAVPFRVLMPAALGTPGGVFLREGRVTATYEPGDGLPTDPRTRLGALFTQFRASLDEEFLLAKLPETGTTVERVSVGDAPGFWLEGAPHAVYYVDEAGEVVEDTVRLAGNVLLWERGGVTYRLEADVSREEAIAIATSV